MDKRFLYGLKNWVKEKRFSPTLLGNNRVYIFLLNIAMMIQYKTVL